MTAMVKYCKTALCNWGGAMPCQLKSPHVHVAVPYFGVGLEGHGEHIYRTTRHVLHLTLYTKVVKKCNLKRLFRMKIL
jgi:hypothetical protein